MIALNHYFIKRAKLCHTAAIACRSEMTKNRYRKLMHYVCVGHGYCGTILDGSPMHVDNFIPDRGHVSAHQFAEWVMLADGYGPDSSPRRARHKNNIEVAFIKYMGAEVIPAQELKWDAEA